MRNQILQLENADMLSDLRTLYCREFYLANHFIQGPHDKLALKENVSHTLKNEVIILIFWYYLKIVYRRG